MGRPRYRTRPGRPPMDTKALNRLFRESAIIRPEPEPIVVPTSEEVQAAGRLLPGFSGATVAVDFISGGQRETRLTTTDAAGNWKLTFDPEVGGLWEVKAYFAGDTTRAAAESNRCRFQVERPTCECAPKTFRTIHWLALGLGIFALVLFLVQREQRCRNAKIAAMILIALAVIGLIACWYAHLASSFVILMIALGILFWWYLNCVRRKKVTATTG